MNKDRDLCAEFMCRAYGRERCVCDDAKAVIGDIAISGNRLQQVVASGIVSGRVALACGELFTEIAELVGSAVPANDDGSE